MITFEQAKEFQTKDVQTRVVLDWLIGELERAVYILEIWPHEQYPVREKLRQEFLKGVGSDGN